MKNLLEGTTKSIQNGHFFGFVDVRDVAKLQVELVEGSSKGRHITCLDSSIFAKDICKYITKKYGKKFKVTKNVIQIF
jgi:hypothetical protein